MSAVTTPSDPPAVTNAQPAAPEVLPAPVPPVQAKDLDTLSASLEEKFLKMMERTAEQAAERAVTKYRSIQAFRDARKRWITISMACRQFGKGKAWIYELIQTQRIRSSKKPGRGCTGQVTLVHSDDISRELGIPC